MAELRKITNPEELTSIVDFIHDCKFDKEKIVFHPETTVLEITFYRETPEKSKIISRFLFFKKRTVPVVEYLLKILHVENYQIHEGSQIGPASEDFFNIITYDKQEKQLRISTVISKGILIKVKDFEISIEDTGRVVEEKSRVGWVSEA